MTFGEFEAGISLFANAFTKTNFNLFSTGFGSGYGVLREIGVGRGGLGAELRFFGF